MFEHRKSPLLPRAAFLRRVARSFLLGLGVLTVTLALGMSGYHFLEHQPWLDAFVNAAMILSGMGPVEPLHTTAGKLFAGCYALFSGLLFIGVAGVVLVPIAHRLLHKFHLEAKEKKES